LDDPSATFGCISTLADMELARAEEVAKVEVGVRIAAAETGIADADSP